MFSCFFAKLQLFSETMRFFQNFINKNIFQILRLCQRSLEVRTAARPLSYNVVAAWRQAGVSAKFGREQTMLLPALYHTSLHPRLRQTAR